MICFLLNQSVNEVYSFPSKLLSNKHPLATRPGNHGTYIEEKNCVTWHVYGKTMWKEPKRGEFVFAVKYLNEEALLYDTFSVAWKRKLTTKVNADVVGHLPREISRAVWFFITHGGSLTGKVHSPK